MPCIRGEHRLWKCQAHKDRGKVVSDCRCVFRILSFGRCTYFEYKWGTDTECEENADAENSEVTDATASTEEETPSEEENFDDSAESGSDFEDETAVSGEDSLQKEQENEGEEDNSVSA